MGRVICLEFTNDLANLDANEFTHLLVDGLHMKGIVTGPDFAWGATAAATWNTCGGAARPWASGWKRCRPWSWKARRCAAAGFATPWPMATWTAPSTCWAAPMPPTAWCVHGAKMGRQLGFPTANIIPTQNFVIPADGVYATYATVNGVRHLAATSIGVRPTFGLSQRLIEAHLLDFSADIYDENLRLGVRLPPARAGNL